MDETTTHLLIEEEASKSNQEVNGFEGLKPCTGCGQRKSLKLIHQQKYSLQLQERKLP